MGPYSDTNPHIVDSVYIREIKHSIYSEYSYMFSLVILLVLLAQTEYTAPCIRIIRTSESP